MYGQSGALFHIAESVEGHNYNIDDKKHGVVDDTTRFVTAKTRIVDTEREDEKQISALQKNQELAQLQQ